MSDYPAGEFLLPIFPLPNLVFFPGTRLPLHIFEPRYRQMVADAITSGERIGIVLLRPDWEAQYYHAPPIHNVGTLGLIERVEKLDDGRYNLVLNGVVRFRILEQVAVLPYRIARVIAAPEGEVSAEESDARRERLIDLSRRYLEFLPGENQVPELGTAGLDELTSALVMSLLMDVEEKQKLLEIDDIITRSEQVAEVMKEKLDALQFLKPFRKRDIDPAAN
ncbi:MAG TPA: LON peptidase substrate-binding domain-containing protein [Thermoanaerobaculia bacterium]|nr:LON peptidase substrate-binding domain-containing protein [Thermoanaerobaculia bacterium]